MAGKEGFVFITEPFEGFQLAGAVYFAVLILTYIERYDSDGVAGNEEIVFLLIIKGEGKDAVQVFEEVNTFVTVKGKDDFAVASRLEIIFSGVLCTNIPMVVDFSVHGEDLFPVGTI